MRTATDCVDIVRCGATACRTSAAGHHVAVAAGCLALVAGASGHADEFYYDLRVGG